MALSHICICIWYRLQMRIVLGQTIDQGMSYAGSRTNNRTYHVFYHSVHVHTIETQRTGFRRLTRSLIIPAVL